MTLSKLPNIGPTLETELNAIGVRTYDDLKSLGSVEAVLRLGVVGNACYNKLYALEGAILGIRWHDMPSDHKNQLKDAYKKRL